MKYLQRPIFLFLMILVLFLTSCAQSRLNRLLDRHPELKQSVTVSIDTTLKVVSPKAEIDTSFPMIEIKDTVVFIEGQLRVGIWEHQDTLYLDAECDTVEILVPFETQVEVEKIIYKKARDCFASWVLFTILCLVIYFLAKRGR